MCWATLGVTIDIIFYVFIILLIYWKSIDVKKENSNSEQTTFFHVLCISIPAKTICLTVNNIIMS